MHYYYPRSQVNSLKPLILLLNTRLPAFLTEIYLLISQLCIEHDIGMLTEKGQTKQWRRRSYQIRKQMNSPWARWKKMCVVKT